MKVWIAGLLLIVAILLNKMSSEQKATSSKTVESELAAFKDKWEKFGQGHVFNFLSKLTDEQKSLLLENVKVSLENKIDR